MSHGWSTRPGGADTAATDTLFEMKQKLNAPGPSALMQTAGLPVSQP